MSVFSPSVPQTRTVTIQGTTNNISSTPPTSQDLSVNRTATLDLIDTAVTPGTYLNAQVTVDQKGRITGIIAGDAASNANPYVTIGSVLALSAERALTGTSNQITITDGGPQSTVVLSIPNSFTLPSASPTFTAVVVKNNAKVGGTVFDHFTDVGNVTTAETDLYTDTLAASTLANNGDKITGQYGVSVTGAVSSTQQIRCYFGGTLIFDTGALSIGVATDSLDIKLTIIRVSSSIARCSVTMTSNFATLSSYATYTEVTGLTLANTQILKITGTAAGIGAASNQITAKEGFVQWWPAA